MPTYDNSYEARTRRLKASLIAKNFIADRTKAIQGPSGRDASTFTTLLAGLKPYVIQTATGGRKTDIPGPCCN
jgi:hypothetical protein